MKEQNHFHNPLIQTNVFRRRVVVVTAIVLLLAVILFARLVYLQVYKNHYYSTASHDNSINLDPIAPPRGLIYDRNGRILAENIPVYSLDIIPDKTTDMDVTVKALQNLLDISDDDVMRFYQQLKQKHQFDEIPLKIKLTQQQVAKFYVNQFRYPGAKVTARLIRYYPYKSDMVDMLGYVGRINDSDTKRIEDPSNYAASNYIGKLGIERYFESRLHGTVGYQQIETNAAGQAVRTLQSIAPIPGDDIYLTIDSALQEVAVQAMKKYRGSIVAMDPRNGDILAMVSNPSYDPNLFVRGISNKQYNALRDSPNQPLFNRAIRGQYPLGSVIKPILALEGISSGVVTAKSRIFDPGYFQINEASRIYRNWRPKGQGWMNARSAISQSCDTYFYWLSLKLGIDRISNVMRDFGFGQRTGIQIREELPGLVPSPAVKLARTGTRWYSGDTLNTSIGQGLTLSTPLQLAVATSIIANRGVYYKANLVKDIRTPDGKILDVPPRLGTKINMPEKAWKPIIAGMVDVISAAKGTGYRFGDPAYTVAAKTGTAQLFDVGANEVYKTEDVTERLRDNSMFMAFAPVKHPKIVLAVAIQNNPQAAAIARKVMDYYLLKQKHLFDKNGA
tara:strand:- start:82065 stop:83918 length:1854 start_codon:yes stop_codon:yes gene_type:complete